MSEITKGPWKLAWMEDWIDVCGAQGAFANIRRNGPASEAFAEAAIALPDLLEALREARELLLTIGRPETIDLHHKIYQRMDAALKKAGVP